MRAAPGGRARRRTGGRARTRVDEAVERGGLDTRCYAVDTWRGDDQTGHYGEEVYLDFRRFHDEHYGAFSELVRCTFDEALGFSAHIKHEVRRMIVFGNLATACIWLGVEATVVQPIIDEAVDDQEQILAAETAGYNCQGRVSEHRALLSQAALTSRGLRSPSPIPTGIRN